MFYEVIQLRKGGLKLRHTEWPEPEFGRITMATWAPGRTSLTRTERVATLYQSAWMMQRPVMNLIAPRISFLTFDGEVWEGTQLQSNDDGIREVEQTWLVRPRGKDSQPLPPFDVKRWMETRRAAHDLPEPPVGKGWIKPGQRR